MIEGDNFQEETFFLAVDQSPSLVWSSVVRPCNSVSSRILACSLDVNCKVGSIKKNEGSVGVVVPSLVCSTMIRPDDDVSSLVRSSSNIENKVRCSRWDNGSVLVEFEFLVEFSLFKVPDNEVVSLGEVSSVNIQCKSRVQFRDDVEITSMDQSPSLVWSSMMSPCNDFGSLVCISS